MDRAKTHDIMNVKGGVPVRCWTRGVPFEDEARRQLENVARLPFIYKWVAAMPDVHWGLGATIGSVIPTVDAIIPAAVGVDIGCGMCAARTSLTAGDLPDDLERVRTAIETAVPHGFYRRGPDRGGWRNRVPAEVDAAWSELEPDFRAITAKAPQIKKTNNRGHLGTLGSGNHFIEVCLDEEDRVWVMLHSGSRGVGNKIGRDYIAMAKNEMRKNRVSLPDDNLAFFVKGTPQFDEYVKAVDWAQRFAKESRRLMRQGVIRALGEAPGVPRFSVDGDVIDCHHNYVALEEHYGEKVYITRKGAVRAGDGEFGIIPGSMGAKSFIVRGKGCPESFMSCSHGAGRAMSRKAAKKRFSVEEHARATKGIACRKDAGVLDETPAAYKPIDAVMAAQTDLVEVEHTLRQVVCVKG